MRGVAGVTPEAAVDCAAEEGGAASGGWLSADTPRDPSAGTGAIFRFSVFPAPFRRIPVFGFLNAGGEGGMDLCSCERACDYGLQGWLLRRCRWRRVLALAAWRHREAALANS